jgi:hypothetical protein
MENVLIALGSFMIIAAVPLTAILTHHQRKMAMIVHGSGGSHEQMQKLASLEQELSELRHIVAQQTITLDDVNNLNRRLLERRPETSCIQN